MVNPHIPHIFVLPCLMTHLWRKELGKDADVLFTVACGTPFWPEKMHEPLIVAIVLPLTHVPECRGPWGVRETPEATSLEEQLVRGFVHWAKARHDPENFMTWNVTCHVCGTLLTCGAGIFCSNFLLASGRFPRATIFGAEIVTAQQRAAHSLVSSIISRQQGRRRKKLVGDGGGEGQRPSKRANLSLPKRHGLEPELCRSTGQLFASVYLASHFGCAMCLSF